jgi:LmbE family N-acetylglucosaminyl deacetylase
MIMKKWLVLLLFSSALPAADPHSFAGKQSGPDERFQADLLVVIAHPDDETAIASYLAKAIYDLHKKVALIYLNRGGGGGNSAGIEQSHALAAIREIEARRSAACLGIDLVWFLDGLDTPGQDVFHSLNNSGHGKNLEQLIRLVRLTRPKVMITWLPNYVAGENHGDHQAAGVLAVEAFDLAADPTVFPSQVAVPRERSDINNFAEGLQPWQPQKIYFFSDAAQPIRAAGPAFDPRQLSPSKQLPYYQLACELHRHHLTQGDVAEVALQAQKSGTYSEFLKWISPYRLLFGKSIVPCQPDGDVFDALQTKVQPTVLGQPVPQHQTGIQLALGGIFDFYKHFWQKHQLEHLATMVAPEVTIAYGGYLHIPLLLINGTQDSATIELASRCPAGWRLVSGHGIYQLAPYQTCPVQTFFFAPEDHSDAVQEILWSARAKGREVGSITMRVYLSAWTLPQ